MEDWRLVLMTVASITIDVVAAYAVLFCRHSLFGGGARNKRITLVGMAGAALVLGVVCGTKVVLPVVLGLGFFGLIRLLYLDLVAFLPLLGACVLVASRARRDKVIYREVTWPVRIVATGCLAMLPVGIYATYVEPFQLREEVVTVRVKKARLGNDAVRVGVLADIQTDQVSDYDRDAIDKMMAKGPDIILIPGDLFQGSPAEFDRQFEALRELIQRLEAPGGVWFVMGDSDDLSEIQRLLAGLDIRLLRNEIGETVVGDRRVTIGGTELAYTSSESRAMIRSLESRSGEADIRILVAHRPDVIRLLPEESRVDLVVAGHTHGGQVVIPFYGPPITFSRLPREVGAGGLHTLDSNTLYVSRGVGCERGLAPRIRFLCPPEISLLILDGGSGE